MTTNLFPLQTNLEECHQCSKTKLREPFCEPGHSSNHYYHHGSPLHEVKFRTGAVAHEASEKMVSLAHDAEVACDHVIDKFKEKQRLHTVNLWFGSFWVQIKQVMTNFFGLKRKNKDSMSTKTCLSEGSRALALSSFKNSKMSSHVIYRSTVQDNQPVDTGTNYPNTQPTTTIATDNYTAAASLPHNEGILHNTVEITKDYAHEATEKVKELAQGTKTACNNAADKISEKLHDAKQAVIGH
ncbi:unnamed protein product [Caenorhabditis auriculariae]|uniref:Uncharacterized protein n=1 Tax=Caenorhabditis auriculariae TaxID=2777116 RepID=A0A8S1HPG2_9PELO|nr:unnamed protein product [Caenorhabditis auriculariae]